MIKNIQFEQFFYLNPQARVPVNADMGLEGGFREEGFQGQVDT